jgi:glyoxylase-like metal-dependent hydrolase (beta-lactamase superfamily II)
MALHGAARGVLISGDMVLPRISTNVSVHDVEPEGNPLAQYLASIGRLRALPADTLVLPSHGRPFRKLHVRLRQLRDHHEERLSMLLAACRERPLCAAEVVPLMFNRKFDTHQMTFAMGESLAHLHALWYAGRLSRSVGSAGVVRFAAAPSHTPTAS